MTIDEAFTFIKESRPQLIHVSGKTSTGKSTFATRLGNELGYALIELDVVVNDAVIKPLSLPDRGQVFFEVYKQRSRIDWITRFVTATQRMIRQLQEEGKSVVIDGAIANAETLKELLEAFPETEIIYFHPKNLTTYQGYLTNRFMLTDVNYHAGLPIAFWELVDDTEFQQFCIDRVLTPGLQKAIASYASASQSTSSSRLKRLKQHFEKIHVVDV